MASSEYTKISVRVPEALLRKVSKFYPKESISQIMRGLLEKEVKKEGLFKLKGSWTSNFSKIVNKNIKNSRKNWEKM